MHFSQKTYEIKFEERPKYLFVRIRADAIDREMALSYLNEIVDKCRSINAKRIMLDRQIPAMMSDADNYLIIIDMIRIIGSRQLAVINPFISNEDAMKFGELLGSNRGLPYQIFPNEKSAEAWLTGQKETN